MILLFIVNSPEFFLSHRLPIANAARSMGFSVHVATGAGSACKQIIELGYVHHLLPLTRSGRNPMAELVSILSLFRLMRMVKPDIVHLVTIKPVLYGGIVARFLKVRAVVAAISGLGTLFVSSERECSWLRRGVEWLYKLALGHSNIRVVFQNPDDRSVIMSLGAVRNDFTVLIKGAGVSLENYPMLPEPEGVPVVTFAARLLKDKGVQEYCEAARILKERGVAARFWLVGAPDPENITSVTEREVDHWCQRKELVEQLGYRNDIARVFAQTNVVVLPSYREGLPKVLIEAAACGRAVVTTDVPGCRDAIEVGMTGLLVSVRSASALADAIQLLVEDPIYRRQMGAAGRVLAEREYAIEKVVKAHLDLYRELLRESTPLPH